MVPESSVFSEVKGCLPVAIVILTGRTAMVLYRDESHRGGGGV